MAQKYTPGEMITFAMSVYNPRQLAFGNSAGGVACALESADGSIYTGVCIDIGSGIGFCAEHSAIAALITAGGSKIIQIVAVAEDGRVLPPCGRCREFMNQIDPLNYKETRVILGLDHVVNLSALLPFPWQIKG